MNKRELIRRYIFFIVGLFVNSFGVSFVTKASLGTSPISSIPYTLSLGFAPTLGAFTLYMSIVLIVIQMILLKKNFPKQYFLQIPVSFVFSYFIDFTMELLRNMVPQGYAMKFASLMLGCVILGIGVYMEMVANVVMLPGESFVNAVSKTFHTDFGKTKVAFDSSMTIIAAIIGVVLYHRLAGVGVGTVVAAIIVGMIARFLKRKIGWVEEKWLVVAKAQPEVEEKIQSSNGIVITINREFGSGGRKLAGKLAKELGLAIHDEDIVAMAAKEVGLDEVAAANEEQKLVNGLLYDMIAQVYDQSEQRTIQDRLFEAESKAIKTFAMEGNCVIVGRCADVVCKDIANVYHIFLYADDDFKASEIARREGMSLEDARKHEKHINHMRSNHYKYYTGQDWKDMSRYHICLNTGNNDETSLLSMIGSLIKKN